MGTTLRFLDTTPAGRIVARFTQDIRAVDGNIAMSLQALIEGALALSMRFSVIVYMSPLFLIPGLVIVILGGWLGNTYMAAQVCKMPILVGQNVDCFVVSFLSNG